MHAGSSLVLIPYSARTSNFRRPQTTNTADFWYCAQKRWDGFLSDISIEGKEKAALNNLRKYSAAGHIMETDEGVIAAQACEWCTRPGHNWPCKVYRTGLESACAYCKRHAKSGCSASLNAAPPSMDDRLAALEDAIREQQTINQELRRDMNALLSAVMPGWRSAIVPNTRVAN